VDRPLANRLSIVAVKYFSSYSSDFSFVDAMKSERLTDDDIFTACSYEKTDGRDDHLGCLKYLHENGCPWDERACAAAARCDRLECLKYLHENGSVTGTYGQTVRDTPPPTFARPDVTLASCCRILIYEAWR
jgi:hypothetical protein